MRIKTYVTMLFLAATAIATTACATTSGTDDAPRAERSEREQPRVPSGFY